MKMVRIHAALDAREPRHLEDPRCARSDVLELTAAQALEFFSRKEIVRKLEAMRDGSWTAGTV